jgi:phosphoglycolate phosphatase
MVERCRRLSAAEPVYAPDRETHRHSRFEMTEPGSPVVIFDFDGTLADTWPWFANELVQGTTHLRCRPVTRDEVEQFRSLKTREILNALEVPWWRIPLIAGHMRRRAEESADLLRLFDGVPEMIIALHRAGVRLAIASSNSERTIRQVLGDGLTGMVQHYACNAAVFGKAAIFRRIMRRLCASPANTVAVGDETRDLEAAKKAGIAGIGVGWGYADEQLLRFSTHRIVTTVDQLEQTLLDWARATK